MDELESLRGLPQDRGYKVIQMGIQLALLKESLDDLKAGRAATPPETPGLPLVGVQPGGHNKGAIGGLGVSKFGQCPLTTELKVPSMSLPTYYKGGGCSQIYR